MRTRSAVIAMTVFLAAVCISATPDASALAGMSAATVSPKVVALRLSDFPKGFTQSLGSLQSNAQMAKAVNFPKSQFDKHGRIVGYIEEFDRSSTTGVTTVFANVYAYKTPSGSNWDYVHSVAHNLTQGKRVAVSGVGDARTGILVIVPTNGVNLYVIDFHRGAFDVTIAAGGSRGKVRMSDTLQYARIIDRRIQQQHI